MSESPNLLGEYLRARRDLVTPDQVGIPIIGRRRVPGLRREEVAMLSGISAEYYLRLEQGRDRNPSAQVLRAIARASSSSRTTPTCSPLPPNRPGRHVPARVARAFPRPLSAWSRTCRIPPSSRAAISTSWWPTTWRRPSHRAWSSDATGCAMSSSILPSRRSSRIRRRQCAD